MAACLTPGALRGERGNALVEFALVLPLLLLVFAGIVDFGFLFQRYEVVTNAAREGARLAVVNYPDADVQWRVHDYVTAGLGAGAPAADHLRVPDPELITVTPPTGAPFMARQVTVEITYDYMLLGPIVNLVTGHHWGSQITLRAVSAMRVEAGS